MAPANMLDRISMLPDELLCHILSFLSTQQAVATSVLSKRWRPLWTSVPTLDYDDQIYLKDGEPSSYFEKFVYATILARDEHQPVRSFRLKYDTFNCDSSNADVNAWLKAVIPRDIKNLDINMYPSNSRISLSCCIFKCTTLLALKLEGLSTNVSSVVLPSLKSLHLIWVKFTRQKNLIDLLCGCPILEDLKAHRIYYAQYGDSFRQEDFKSLSKLVRADLRRISMDHPDVPLKAICNVEFLSITKYQLAKMVPEFPNLMHMVLNLVSWDLVFEMLKNSPKLQVFEVSLCGGRADKGFSADPHFVPECLTSQFRRCSLEYCYGTGDLQFAKYIMQNSTTLQTMTIYIDSSLSPQEKHEMREELASCPRISALCELSFK